MTGGGVGYSLGGWEGGGDHKGDSFISKSPPPS